MFCTVCVVDWTLFHFGSVVWCSTVRVACTLFGLLLWCFIMQCAVGSIWIGSVVFYSALTGAVRPTLVGTVASCNMQ